MSKKTMIVQGLGKTISALLLGLGTEEEEGGLPLTITMLGIVSAEAIGTPHISETSSYGYEFGRRTERWSYAPLSILSIAPVGISSKEKIGKKTSIGIDIVAEGIPSRSRVKIPSISLNVFAKGISSKSRTGNALAVLNLFAGGIESQEGIGQISTAFGIRAAGILSERKVGKSDLAFGIFVDGIDSQEVFGNGVPLDAEIMTGRERIRRYEEDEMMTFLMAA